MMLRGRSSHSERLRLWKSFLLDSVPFQVLWDFRRKYDFYVFVVEFVLDASRECQVESYT